MAALVNGKKQGQRNSGPIPVFSPFDSRNTAYGRAVKLEAMTGNLFAKQDDAAPGITDGWYTAHCDGGSRGNPGPSGFGAVIEDPEGQVVARLSEFLGKQTNNYAEYSGLLAVLDWALKNGARRLCVVSDSELMVRQMKGRYKVKSPGLQPLWEEAQRRTAKLEDFEMRHTLRGGNKDADRLANQAMDEGSGLKDRGSENKKRL
jgi:ribonuclease HI